MATVLRSCTLWNNEGAHDKIYKIAIVLNGGRHHVIGANGRRGARYTEQAKGTFDTLARAAAVYWHIIQEKKGRGYNVVEGIAGARVWQYDAPIEAQPVAPTAPIETTKFGETSRTFTDISARKPAPKQPAEVKPAAPQDIAQVKVVPALTRRKREL